MLPPAPAALAASARTSFGDRLRAWLGNAGWQGWAIAAQLAVIAVLAAQLLPHGAAPGYRHLAVAPASTPTCWWLQTDARLQDVQRILQPTAPRSSAVPPSPALHAGRGRHRQAQLLSALRADPSVELAESLTAASQP
jgi:hypothetical protein